MILLTKTTVGTNDPLKLRNYQNSGTYENSARLNRSKLLDGTCSFSPYGVTDQDRDFSIDCRMTEAEFARLDTLFKALDPIKIAFWEGFFIGYIHRLTIQRNGEASITFYFKEQLA